jgi:hypothetical protein
MLVANSDMTCCPVEWQPSDAALDSKVRWPSADLCLQRITSRLDEGCSIGRGPCTHSDSRSTKDSDVLSSRAPGQSEVTAHLGRSDEGFCSRHNVLAHHTRALVTDATADAQRRLARQRESENRHPVQATRAWPQRGSNPTEDASTTPFHTRTASSLRSAQPFEETGARFVRELIPVQSQALKFRKHAAAHQPRD